MSVAGDDSGKLRPMTRRNSELRREIARTAPFARTGTDAEARDD